MKKNSKLVALIIGGVMGVIILGVIVFLVVKEIMKKNKFIKYFENEYMDIDSDVLSFIYDEVTSEYSDPGGWDKVTVTETMSDEQLIFEALIIDLYTAEVEYEIIIADGFKNKDVNKNVKPLSNKKKNLTSKQKNIINKSTQNICKKKRKRNLKICKKINQMRNKK